MEAILAVMIVSISLTSFLCMLSYSELGQRNNEIVLDTDFIENIDLNDNGFTVDDAVHNEMYRFIDRYGLNGAKLDISIAGGICNSHYDKSYGEEIGNNIGCKSGTFPIRSDDGGSFVAYYEVVYWWD